MKPILFSELGLSNEILKAIDKLGFEQAAPIQAEAIPLLLKGVDLVGQSQTGSGKTAAFSLPAIESVDTSLRAVQILILCPTRELAVQVSEEIHKFTLFKRGIFSLPIYGGQSYERQIKGLKQGAQIVIGTPGRVMDHMRRGYLELDQLKTLILDEADTMLDMGFREDIEFILQATPPKRQTVFFSATMPRPIQELIKTYANEPHTIHIQQKAVTVPSVEQFYFEIDRRSKVQLLTRLIDLHDFKLGIVFCNTKRMVDDLCDHLNTQGYSADKLHGDMTQAMRDRVMNKFRKSGLEFLVATDVAARGIDVDHVQVVFNYDLPYDVEDYVHRIGRTGRAGRSGRAISFVSGRELFQIQNIERYTKTRIQRTVPPTIDEIEEAKRNVLLTKIRTILTEGKYKRQDIILETLLEDGFASTDILSSLIHFIQSGETAKATPRSAADDNPPEASSRQSSFGNPREPRSRRERPERFERGERPERFKSNASRSQEDRPYPSSRGETPRSRDERTSSTREGGKPSSGKDRAEKPKRPPTREIQPKDIPIRTGDEAPPIQEFATPKPPKPSKAHTEKAVSKGELARMHLNQGVNQGVTPQILEAFILGNTGLPKSLLKQVDLRENHTFVHIDSEQAKGIISKLNRAQLNGKKVKAKLA